MVALPSSNVHVPVAAANVESDRTKNVLRDISAEIIERIMSWEVRLWFWFVKIRVLVFRPLSSNKTPKGNVVLDKVYLESTRL